MSITCTTLASQEAFIGAFESMARADFDADPVGFIRASNRLFDAMCAGLGHSVVSDLSEDELQERAAARYAAILTNGDR